MSDEKYFVLILFMLYFCTAVGRIAYVVGKDRGRNEYREFQRSLLGVGTVWKVGHDGRLQQVEEDMK